MLAAVAVRDREQNIQKRLETAAERTIRSVSQTLMERLGAAHADVLRTAAEASSRDDTLGLLVAAGSARTAFTAVGQPFIIRLPDTFLYPQSGGIGEVSRQTTTGDEALLAAVRSIRNDGGKPEKAVREYERVLAAPGISFAVLAEATMGAGRCYRELGEFKLAAGAFRQVAGYQGSQDEGLGRADTRAQTERDADGNIYSLSAMSELVDVYRQAADRDSPEARGRWRRLAVESQVELLERVVLLYCKMIPEQRDRMLSVERGEVAVAGSRGVGRAVPSAPRRHGDMPPHQEGRRASTPDIPSGTVPSYERKAVERERELESLLHVQERNLAFISSDGAAVMEAVTREIGNNGIPGRMTWLMIRGTPFTFGSWGSGANAIVGGFKVDMAGLAGFLRELSERLASEHGIVVRLEHAPQTVPGGDLGGVQKSALTMKEGFLVAGALEWPFNGITLCAYAADPGVLKRNTTFRLILKEWGIVMLALGVLAGAWVVFRHAAAETRRLKERGDYVAGISHDLRTPLASMRMLAESLYLGRVEDPARQKQFLETIIGESRRLGHLVERVLFFVRFGENALAYQLRKTDIGEVVRQTVDSFAGSLAAETDRPQDLIQLSVEPDLPPVMADPVAVGQVVLNLLDNAVKYSRKPWKAPTLQAKGSSARPPGDKSRTGTDGSDAALQRTLPSSPLESAQEDHSGRIAVRVVRSGNGGVEMSVRDDGPGMDKRELKKIFRKFYRVRGGGRDAAPGIGLGLALCQHIVMGHGGRISVASEPGKGSTFTVYLPPAGQREKKSER